LGTGKGNAKSTKAVDNEFLVDAFASLKKGKNARQDRNYNKKAWGGVFDLKKKHNLEENRSPKGRG